MTATAHRISDLRYLAADWHTRLFGPTHNGADDTWLADLRNAVTVSRPTDTDTAVIPAVRDALALASVPYRLVDDPVLGELVIGPQAAPAIYDEMKGEKR